MSESEAILDLSGQWNFSLDRDVACADGVIPSTFHQTIRLPGSLQAQGFGDDISIDTPWTGQRVDRSWYTAARYAPYRKPGNIKVPFWLQPEKHFVGAAWYQREIDIPAQWRGKRIVLTLERAHIQSKLWIDGHEIGSQNILGAPHVYDLGAAVVPGKHALTIQIDNRVHLDIGPNSHSISDHTQTNWNGIIGRIELSATSPVWIEDAQAFPKVSDRSVRLRINIGNSTGRAGKGKLLVGEQAIDVAWTSDGGSAEIVCSLGADAALWDEFNPALHRLRLRLTGDQADHQKEITFGLREVGIQGTQITVNGRKMFLRGTLECAVFPKTGYPTTDISEWRRIFEIIKNYGFNHVRFHSWCPPESAFSVADELGVYLQIECSSWANTTAALGVGQPVDAWLYDEARAIIKNFGNHPSFLLMAYGNEPAGKHEEYLAKWVEHWKKEEPRRLHTSAAGWPSIAENQYDNVPEPRIQAWGEGNTSRINRLPPETTADYSLFVNETPRPIVSHEIGQWCVYPDFSEIPKYTGLLKAKNFEIFRETLQNNHMGDQAGDFLQASGKLQVLCYREEIEAALRTSGFGGFHILQMNDFPGQGTALVGWMNPFWESKGYTSPQAFRRFNNSTVLLARLDRRVFTTRGTLRADIEVAHFEAAPMDNARPYWKLLDENGRVHASGELPSRTLPVDNGIQLGSIEISLGNLAAPAKYRLVVGLAQTSFENDWEIWLYPANGSLKVPGGIEIARDWRHLLECAKRDCRVLFVPHEGFFNDKPALGFSSIFWNTSWTNRQPPETLGILCDPSHPLLADFPTEFHSNWQWWELIRGASALVMDRLPAEIRPIVQVIDDWFTNRRLGLIFEARLNQCRMVFSGIDLIGAIAWRPAARQMRQSIINYMAGLSFDPQFQIDPNALERKANKSVASR